MYAFVHVDGYCLDLQKITKIYNAKCHEANELF